MKKNHRNSIRFQMARVFGLLLSISAATLHAQEFWISTTGNVSGQANQPTTQAQLPSFPHGFSDVNGDLDDGTLYLWGRPGFAGIQNFSLRLIANSDLISFAEATVTNPFIGASSRWEETLNPTGTLTEDSDGNTVATLGDLTGINLGLTGEGRTSGVGLLNNDPFYDSVTNGWLIAEVPYNLSRMSNGMATEGVVDVAMAIGGLGMNSPNGSVSDFTAKLGFASAPAFNAKNQRCVERFGELVCGFMSKSAEIQIGNVQPPGLACDFVGPAGCDIQDLNSLFAGTNGAPNLTSASIQQWLQDASATNNPAKLSSSHIYVPGDLNLDGRVDSTDLGGLLNRFGQTGANWSHGNFNTNGVVDSTDLGALLNNFGSSSSASAVVVPEPKVAFWLFLVAFMYLGSSRKS